MGRCLTEMTIPDNFNESCKLSLQNQIAPIHLNLSSIPNPPKLKLNPLTTPHRTYRGSFIIQLFLHNHTNLHVVVQASTNLKENKTRKKKKFKRGEDGQLSCEEHITITIYSPILFIALLPRHW